MPKNKLKHVLFSYENNSSFGEKKFKTKKTITVNDLQSPVASESSMHDVRYTNLKPVQRSIIV